MSDYYSPYSPPDERFDFNAYSLLAVPEAQSAARVASIVMLILAGLAFGCSAMFFLVRLVPLDQVPPEQLQGIQRVATEAGLPLKTFFLVYALFALIPALVYLTLGIWVRGARLAAIFTAMIANGLFLLLLLLSLGVTVLSGQAGGIGSMLMPAIIGAAMIFIMKRLAVAARAARLNKYPTQQFNSGTHDDQPS